MSKAWERGGKNVKREGKDIEAMTQPQWGQKGPERPRCQDMKTRGGLVGDGFLNRAEQPEHSDPKRMVVSSVQSCHEMSST